MLNYAGGTPVTAYNLTRSLRFRSAATAYLSRTPATTGTGGSKTWTYSLWVKRGVLGVRQVILDGYAASAGHELEFGSNDILEFASWGGAAALDLATTQVFRDPSAWYHIVLAVDTTQATAANRMKLYVNGNQVTAFGVATYPALNALTYIGSNVLQEIGKRGDNQFYFDGYTTEINFVDGQQLTPSSFGSTNALTGVWQPARYTGTYGTNGFYLPFTDNSALTTSSNVGLGKDFSGNGNYWITNNISITAGATYDSMTDVPTLTSASAANFCVLNAVNQPSSTTLNDGNLKIVATTASYRLSQSTFTLTSGKYYFEMTKLTAAQYVNGLALVLPTLSKDTSTINQAGVYAITHAALNQISSYTNGGGAVTISTVDWANNDIIQCAYDATTGKIWFGRNGTYYPATNGGAIGDPALGTNQTITGVSGLTPTVISYDTSSSCAINFGQRPFTYTPPSGFVALNTYNIPTSTILKGTTVMDATLYTGTLLSNAVTNAAAFRPDLVWVKSRSAATSNKFTDSVRGVTKALVSNSTAAETTDVQGLTTINANGFTVGTDTTYNNLAATYVAWQWQAGQGSSAANTNGTITSTVSVNASAGFSVATYTGSGANATVGHGLGVAPSMIITKNRGATSDWGVYHSSLTSAAYFLLLNSTAAQASGPTYWNSAAPTSSVFSVGTATPTNASANTYVAYCWTPIAGYSAFGSYTGNNSASGPFVYLGFKPRWIMVKPTGSGGWAIYDTARKTFNTNGVLVFAEDSAAEVDYGASSADTIDVLSNGFRVTSGIYYNNSGASYIYAAFASNPFKNSLAQ